MNTATTPTTAPGVARGSYRRTARPSSSSSSKATKVAVVYLRVSTAEQASKGADAEGYSIPAQREACYRKAKELGAEVVDQYIDRGETAKVADRPALNLMLARIADQGDIDYVIVHKLDRLARNRMDDANLTFAIAQHGARLISCSEHIDDTPAGKLTHGILAVINQYQSDNLATESTKGMLKKAQLGGTPGKAPIGYRNVRQRINGDDVATVIVDEERAPHVRWAFRAFSGGDLSLGQLEAELDHRGLRTPPAKSRGNRPMSKSMIARMLRDRYYIGFVTYKGVDYDGNHEPLIDPDTFWTVQEVLAERSTKQTKLRTHKHYLRGLLFCARCDRQLVFTRSRGRRGDDYDYFFCPGRREGCNLPYVATSEIEDELVGFWQRSIAMPANLASAIRTHVEKQVTEERDDIDRQMRKHRRAVATISSAQERLLDAYLSGTITKEQFSERQEKHAKQMAAAERALQANRVHWNDVERTFTDVLELAQHAGAAYARASGEVRRQLNRAFFTRIIVDAETIQGAEVTDTFAAIVTEDVIRRAATPRDEANPAAEPWEGYDVRGSNTFRLVPPTGFEPVPPP